MPRSVMCLLRATKVMYTTSLYVCAKDCPELKRHIAFRDYLRSHPQAVKEYGEIKEKGARLYPNDIDKYMEYKSGVIERIYEMAKIK